MATETTDKTLDLPGTETFPIEWTDNDEAPDETPIEDYGDPNLWGVAFKWKGNNYHWPCDSLEAAKARYHYIKSQQKKLFKNPIGEFTVNGRYVIFAPYKEMRNVKVMTEHEWNKNYK